MADQNVDAVLAAGLAWLYDTPQPPRAISDHHGVAVTIDDRRYSFVPLGLRDLPVVVINVARPQYSDDYTQLINPLEPGELARFADSIRGLGHAVQETWNGEFETGSVGLAQPAHESLRAAVDRYREGCTIHPARSVFCDCGWYADGAALLRRPSWPEGIDRG